ncbi:MAG: zinc ribbon domain-containing protein [Sphingobacteriia bacterium]|nr:zinc ribbon domain-containing protein [Sphingobacteriia bacterium]
MYCIECGAQIPDNSKFCSHCGHKQTEGEPTLKEKLAEVIIEKEITRQVAEVHKSSIDYQFLKKAMGWYLAWILLHLSLLLIFSGGAFKSENSNGGFNDFWPFDGFSRYYYWGDKFAYYYDITEFLVYTIFPLAILVIISLTWNQNTTENKSE